MKNFIKLKAITGVLVKLIVLFFLLLTSSLLAKLSTSINLTSHSSYYIDNLSKECIYQSDISELKKVSGIIQMISKKDTNVEIDPKWDKFSKVIMILWLPIGIVLSIISVLQALALAVTIIGIPVALVIAKSIPTYFNPVNKVCVSTIMADELERVKVQEEISKT